MFVAGGGSADLPTAREGVAVEPVEMPPRGRDFDEPLERGIVPLQERAAPAHVRDEQRTVALGEIAIGGVQMRGGGQAGILGAVFGGVFVPIENAQAASVGGERETNLLAEEDHVAITADRARSAPLGAWEAEETALGMEFTADPNGVRPAVGADVEIVRRVTGDIEGGRVAREAQHGPGGVHADGVLRMDVQIGEQRTRCRSGRIDGEPRGGKGLGHDEFVVAGLGQP